MQSGPDIGSRIWSYVLEEEIGRGGMGVVYRGRHLALGREVAIKVLAPHLSEDPSFRERFLREAQLAASLDHPHIVPVFDAGEAEGWLFIAMKYVRGQDLSAAIRSEGRLDVNRTLLILGQVAGALDVAHRRGLVHRDVKPANVLLEPREEGEHAYLSDFGLTKPIQGATALTHTGQVLGTLSTPRRSSCGATRWTAGPMCTPSAACSTSALSGARLSSGTSPRSWWRRTWRSRRPGSRSGWWTCPRPWTR
jgi:serine/threonine protein kinase